MENKWNLITLNPHSPWIMLILLQELPEGSRHVGEMTCSALSGKKEKEKFRFLLILTSAEV